MRRRRPRSGFRSRRSCRRGKAGYGVYVVTGAKGEETAKLRPVEIGPVIGTDITVVRGLADGDEVITSGANLLKDAQRVEIVK